MTTQMVTSATGTSLQRLAEESWERIADGSRLYFEDQEWTGSQLADRGLMPEEWGGHTVMVEVSAKSKKNLPLLSKLAFVNTIQLDSGKSRLVEVNT